jgi:hypothetical protein
MAPETESLATPSLSALWAHIEKLQRMHRRRFLFRLLDGDEIPDARRIEEINKFVIFALVFQDGLLGLKEALTSRGLWELPEYQHVREHLTEDMGHDKLVLHDYVQRNRVQTIPVLELDSILFCKKHYYVRAYGYHLYDFLINSPLDPKSLLLRFAIVESTNEIFLKDIKPSNDRYERATG